MATLGKVTAGSTSSTSSGARCVVSKHTAAGSGELDKGYAALWMDSGMTGTAKLCVYVDSAGAPGAKLAESDEKSVTSTTSGNVEAFTFSGGNRIGIVDTTDYWLGPSWLDPGSLNINYGRDSTASARQDVQSYAPNPFGAPSSQAGPVAAYVEFLVDADDEEGGFFEFF